MVFGDVFVVVSESGCSNSLFCRVFLWKINESLQQRWSNWWFDHGSSSLLWNCHECSSLIRKNIPQFMGILVVFGWICLLYFAGAEMFLSLFFLHWGKMEASMEEEHSKKSERTMHIYSITCSIVFPVSFHLFPIKGKNIPIPSLMRNPTRNTCFFAQSRTTTHDSSKARRFWTMRTINVSPNQAKTFMTISQQGGKTMIKPSICPSIWVICNSCLAWFTLVVTDGDT